MKAGASRLLPCGTSLGTFSELLGPLPTLSLESTYEAHAPSKAACCEHCPRLTNMHTTHPWALDSKRLQG